MIRKIVLLIVLLPLFCSGQKIVWKNQNSINYKDIVDIKGLIYFKIDTNRYSAIEDAYFAQLVRYIH